MMVTKIAILSVNLLMMLLVLM